MLLKAASEGVRYGVTLLGTGLLVLEDSLICDPSVYQSLYLAAQVLVGRADPRIAVSRHFRAS